jgi:hypothetical protein
MIITTFKNMKGLIHGPDPKRISCNKPGVLKIGKVEVSIPDGTDAVMPMLFYGCSGSYPATFTTANGRVYNLDKVSVKGGWIQPPRESALELMDLRCRLDSAEEEREALREEIRRLDSKFDTNSLNFLIN